MSELKQYKFSELYDMSSGISSKPEQAGHGFPFASFSAVFNNQFLPGSLPDLMDTSEKERKTYSIKEGDIFLTRTSETLDELGMSSVVVNEIPNATYSGFLKRLRPKQTDVSYHKFMAFYLRSKLFRKTMSNNAIMTLRASLNEQIFSYLDLLLPEYKEQQKIGDYLYLLNQKIELNNLINTELEAMAKLIYDYWFVQFDFPDANGKPYKSSGGKMVYNEALKREIPEGWEASPLPKLLEIKTGKQDANYSSNDGQYHFFTCADKALRCDGYEFEGKSILLAGNGNFNVKRYDGKFNAYQRTYVLKPHNPNFFSLVFYAVQYKTKQLANGSRGSIVKFITKGDIEDICVPMPINHNNYFYDVLNTNLKKIDTLYRENLKLEELRDWLLPMLMNGQITVNETSQKKGRG
ncbi:MAG: restriction endonuclease subunit S [Candidatus Reddybacter sp.]